MSTTLHLRRSLAAGLLASLAALALAPSAVGQTPSVSANPNTGPAGSSFTLTLSGFSTLSECNPNPGAATRQTCIFVDFIQGTKTTNIAVASGSNAATVKVPPACPTAASTNCSDVGPATIRATSPNGQTGSTGFTVTAAGPTTSSPSTTAATTSTTTIPTTSSSSTSTTATTVLATTPPTTIKPKKKSSHSDVPRYIAVALVVLAAAATAAVDTRLRRIGPPAPPA